MRQKDQRFGVVLHKFLNGGDSCFDTVSISDLSSFDGDVEVSPHDDLGGRVEVLSQVLETCFR